MSAQSMPRSSSEGQQQTGQSKGSASMAAPSISLAKGGGAIRGIGEKSAANPVTGTGSMSVPIFTSPGALALATTHLTVSFDSGSGNGPSLLAGRDP